MISQEFVRGLHVGTALAPVSCLQCVDAHLQWNGCGRPGGTKIRSTGQELPGYALRRFWLIIQVGAMLLAGTSAKACPMKTVLLVCPTMWDEAELKLGSSSDANAAINGVVNRDAAPSYRVLPHGTDVSEAPERFDAAEFVERTVVDYAGRIDGVMASDDYPGSIVAAAIARELRLPGPDPATILRCQHKYHSRLAQQTGVPEVAPEFTLLDPSTIDSVATTLKYPLFVKPVKSFFSVLAERVESPAELLSLASRAESHLREFVKPFNQLLSEYAPSLLDGSYLLAEQPLTGVQVTVEGCVFQGEVGIIGITDSVMYPGTISFERFEFPSTLPQPVQRRMEELATRFVRSIGYDNGLFNIEMFYDAAAGSIHFVEINPRMCPQFADLMEKVNGVNTYEIALAIAAGDRPNLQRGLGLYPVAASFALRLFEDAAVLRVPDAAELQTFQERFPDARLESVVSSGAPALPGAAGRKELPIRSPEFGC